MRYLALLLLSPIIGVFIAIMVINSGVLHDRMEREIRTRTGVPVELGKIHIPFQWPPTVLLHATKVPTPVATLEFKSLLVTIGSLFEPYDFRIYLREPKVVLQLAVANLQRPPPAAGAAAQGAKGEDKPAQFRLLLNVQDGEFRATDLSVSKFNLEFDQKLWMKTPARLKASARVKTQFFPGELPISVESDSFAFSDESVKASNVKASFAGLNAVVQGTSLLKDGRHRWVAEVKAPNLAMVPAPFELPASGWQGAVEINAEVTKESNQKPWAAEGHGSLKDVSANLKWKNEKYSVEGPVLINAQGKFTYVDEKIAVPELAGYVDLERAKVEAAGLLSKPAGTPLRADLTADGNLENFNIQKIELLLWQIKATVTGQVAMKSPYNGQLTLDLKPTSLKGLESVILPLKNSPVQGELAMQGTVKGPLGDPWNTNIVARNFRLKNFSADVSYDTGGTIKARGPIAANLEVVGEIDRGKPKKFSANGNMQLSGLALVAGPLRKEAKQPLSAVFSVEGDGTALKVDQMALTGFLGQIKANGNVSEPLKPKLNMRIDMRPLDLSELRMALPEFRESIPKGSITGNVGLNGEIATGTPWHTWPLKVTGSAKIQIPEYHVASAPPAPAQPSGGGTAPAVVTPPESFLPKGYLTENLNMQFGVTVGVLTKDTLTVKGVDSQGQINKGTYRGGVTVREIFGGKAALTETEVPLLEARPKIFGQIALEQLIVQDALGFAKPEYKTMATGRMSGRSSFATRMPADPRFMEELKAKGQMNFEPITLNTVQVGKLINDMLKKVPVLKLPPAKVEPLKGQVKADFSMESQAVTLMPLHAVDVSGSELDLKGKVAMPTMQGDLAGTFAWVNPDVKGCLLEGNADDKGRLVVPLAIKGNLMQPELSMVSDTAAKLAGKALECEKTKIVDQFKKDGGKKLEQEAKKVLKGLLGK